MVSVKWYTRWKWWFSMILHYTRRCVGLEMTLELILFYILYAESFAWILSLIMRPVCVRYLMLLVPTVHTVYSKHHMKNSNSYDEFLRRREIVLKFSGQLNRQVNWTFFSFKFWARKNGAYFNKFFK